MERRHDQGALLRAFKSLGDELSEDLDVAGLLEHACEKALALTGARWAAAGRTHQGAIQHLAAAGETGDVRATKLLETIEQRNEIVRGDLDPSMSELDDPGTVAGVPLYGPRSVTGALAVGRPRDEGPFDDVEVDILCVLSSLVAAGIGNIALLEAEGGRLDRSTVLRRLATRVRHSLDSREVLAATVEELGRAAEVDRCFIRMVDAPGRRELGPIEYEWDSPGTKPLSRDVEKQYPIAAMAALTRMTQYSDDILVDDRLRDPDVPGSVEDLLETGTRASLAAPLMWGDELMGIVAFHCSTPRRWSDLDTELIESAAEEVAVGLHHARLYSQAVETADDLARLDELRREFVSMVSHELRSPMTVVAGIADILQKRADELPADQRRELIDTLGREARRLTRLVSEMLDLEAIDQGAVSLHPREIEVGQVAGEAIKDAGQAERARLHVPTPPPVVVADRDRIKQVLINLLSNAAKFSPETEPINVSVVDDADAVVVSVSDTGPGMTIEETERLFKRFSRIASTGDGKPGSGLGLYLSKVLVEKHGGRIWVESKPGAGSTFSFRLPKKVEPR